MSIGGYCLVAGVALAFATAWSLSAVEIIAHRGASFDAPENTMAAFKRAYEHGADAAELDIYRTRDNKIAVIHDSDLKRVGGVPLQVAESTLAELQAPNVGAFGKWRGGKFVERVPALAEVLAIIPAGKRLFIEIKCHEEILPALAEAFAATYLEAAQLPIITFHYEVAKAAKERFPAHEVLWLHSWSKDKENPTVDELIRKAKEAGLDGLDLHYGFPIDHEFAEKVHAAGLKIYAWTVDDPAVARAEQAAGVDGITTNRPRWIREQLSGSRGASPK